MQTKLEGHGFGVARKPPHSSYVLGLLGSRVTVTVVGGARLVTVDADAEDVDEDVVGVDEEDEVEVCVTETRVVGGGIPVLRGMEPVDLLGGDAVMEDVAAARDDAPRIARAR